jgi:hypothetical protein
MAARRAISPNLAKQPIDGGSAGEKQIRKITPRAFNSTAQRRAAHPGLPVNNARLRGKRYTVWQSV